MEYIDELDASSRVKSESVRVLGSLSLLSTLVKPSENIISIFISYLPGVTIACFPQTAQFFTPFFILNNASPACEWGLGVVSSRAYESRSCIPSFFSSM